MYHSLMNKKISTIAIVILLAFVVGYFVSSGDRNTENASIRESTENTSTADSGSVDLDLSGQGLTSLPDSITSRTDVKSLNLSNNQLTTLPESIANMTGLEVLNIENNRIDSLPSELSELKNLRQILANNNRMDSVPTVLSTMTWLGSLDISGNSISAGEIAELKSELPDTEVKP